MDQIERLTQQKPSTAQTAKKRQEMADLATRLQDGLATGATERNEMDEAAYRDFARYFGPRFLALFRQRGLAQIEAEDLAETCVTDIALKLPKYRETENGSFEAWVFTLARNALADWFASRLNTVPLPDSNSGATGGKPLKRLPKVQPDAQIIAAINDALAQLPEADRQLIQLRDFIDDFSFDEVGFALGISAGNARVRHHRILKRLEKLLVNDPRLTDWFRRIQQRTRKDS